MRKWEKQHTPRYTDIRSKGHAARAEATAATRGPGEGDCLGTEPLLPPPLLIHHRRSAAARGARRRRRRRAVIGAAAGGRINRPRLRPRPPGDCSGVMTRLLIPEASAASPSSAPEEAEKIGVVWGTCRFFAGR